MTAAPDTHLPEPPAHLPAPGGQWALAGMGEGRRIVSFGLADAPGGRPVLPETMFLSSSTTKVLTALLVLQAVERGELSLDSPLSECLPGTPYPDAITIRMLLAHRAGLPNPNPMAWVHDPAASDRFDEGEALAEVMRRHPDLRAPPGGRYLYSNLGYWLLGRILERATGQRFGDLLGARIAAPLGLGRGDLGSAFPSADIAARGHVRRFGPVHALLRVLHPQQIDAAAGRWVRLAPLEMNGPAYGGVFARAGAYLAIAADLMRDRPVLLRPAARDALLDPEMAEAGTANAFGLRVGRLNGHLYLSKPGGGPGFCSNLRIYPARRRASVWLANAVSFSERRIERLSDQLDSPFLPPG